VKINEQNMSEAARLAHNITVGVSVATGIGLSKIMSRDRTKHVSRARQLAMRRLYDAGPEWSTTRVGRYFGRDHSTVVYALRRCPEGS
jgi:chromosomal replication initiation ATPase DnaA